MNCTLPVPRGSVSEPKTEVSHTATLKQFYPEFGSVSFHPTGTGHTTPMIFIMLMNSTL